MRDKPRTSSAGKDSAGCASSPGKLMVRRLVNLQATGNIYSMAKHTKTLKVRVKDKHRPLLNQMARSVNFVWNYVNELSHRSIKEHGVFLSAYDIHKYVGGSSKELGLHSHTVQKVGAEYVIRRKQFKKARLNWRKSGGARRSPG